MLAPTERAPHPLSALALPSALLAAELGPAVMADDPCDAAFASATPTGPRNYYRARYYDPKIGRFLSEDPIGFTTGVNFYAYVGNSPVRFRDPSGLMEVSGSGQTATYRGVPWLNDQGFFWPQPANLTFKCREGCGGGWKLEFTIQYQYLMKYPTCCPGVQQEEEAHKAAWEAGLRKWGAPAEKAEGVYPSEDECRRAGERGRAQTMANPMSGSGNEGHGPVDRFWKWLRDLVTGS